MVWRWLRATLLITAGGAFLLTACDSDNGGNGGGNGGNTPINLGPNVSTVIEGDAYVVHSQMEGVSQPGREINTTNIYVIQGNLRQGLTDVIVFGAGYGDPGGDVLAYRNTADALRSAQADAEDVDEIIQEAFGLTPADVRIQFVTPHFHLDHLNQEFFTALFGALGYSQSAADLYLHVNDEMNFAGCTSPCCGGGGGACTQRNVLFGAPYTPQWQAATLARLQPLGSASDACNTDLRSFSTPTGTWTIRKDANVANGGHTDGSVNLDNPSRGIRLYGSASTACSLPQGINQTYAPHGRL